MDEQQRVEFLETTLERLLEWVEATDQKVPYITAIDTAMLAVLATLLPKAGEWHWCTFLWIALGAFPPLLSLFFVCMATIPRTVGPSDSLIFFDSIRKRSRDEYVRMALSVTHSEYIRDLAHQCHRNAEIASTKYVFVKMSIQTLFLAIITWVLSIIILRAA